MNLNVKDCQISIAGKKNYLKKLSIIQNEIVNEQNEKIKKNKLKKKY